MSLNNFFPLDLPLNEAYQFGIENNLQEEITLIRDMKIDWGPAYCDIVRRGFIVDLFIQKGIFEAFKQSCWTNGNNKDGEKRISGYQKLKHYVDLENSISPQEKEKIEKERQKWMFVDIINNIFGH